MDYPIFGELSGRNVVFWIFLFFFKKINYIDMNYKKKFLLLKNAKIKKNIYIKKKKVLAPLF